MMRPAVCLYVLALGASLLVACGGDVGTRAGSGSGSAGVGGGDTLSDPGGTGGRSGADGAGGENVHRFACSAEGLRSAIDVGGGPHRFDCDRPTDIKAASHGVVIDTDVILDGEGELILDEVLIVADVTAELRGFKLTARENLAGFQPLIILNSGTLTVVDSTATANRLTTERVLSGEIIYYGVNEAELMLTNSIVSSGLLSMCGGITEIVESTLSTSLHLVENRDCLGTSLSIASSEVRGECLFDQGSEHVSLGHNVESPGDTCGFDHTTDRVNARTEDLTLTTETRAR
jgi:hypothetical protein